MLDLVQVGRLRRTAQAAGRRRRRALSSERRKHERFGVNFPVTFTSDTVNGEGSALNVSREGCLIESDARVEEGAYLAMSLHTPQALMPLEVELAAIRWVDGRVFGVEFRYMQPDQHESLEKLLSTLQANARS